MTDDYENITMHFQCLKALTGVHRQMKSNVRNMTLNEFATIMCNEDQLDILIEVVYQLEVFVFEYKFYSQSTYLYW